MPAPRFTTKNVKPTLGYVLVKCVQRQGQEEKIGSIVMPDSAKTPFDIGEVLDIGPGELTITATRLPMPCKKGDIVLYYGTPRIIRTVDGTEMELIAHTEVHAVIEG